MSSTWTFGNTALTSFGKVTLINDYLDVPARRGDNLLVPFHHGSIFAQKYYGERSLVFGMAITAANATALETVFDTMRAKFAPLTEQVLANTREDSTVRQANAIVNKSIQVTRFTNTLAKVVVEFELSDPIFRLSSEITDNTATPNANSFAYDVTNPGTVQETDPTIVLTGLYTTSVTITNAENGAILVYGHTIDDTEVVTIGTLNHEYYATSSTDGDVIGRVTHSGSPALMPIEVGVNNLTIASAGQNGNTRIRVRFYAPYL
jgi:hypothetical protein